MNPSRIEQAIDEIYNYVEECKPSKLYPSKVVVDREQLYDLLDELRLCAPEEIKRYQKIITNREGILNEAQQRAEDMLSQAQQQTEMYILESRMHSTKALLERIEELELQQKNNKIAMEQMQSQIALLQAKCSGEEAQ